MKDSTPISFKANDPDEQPTERSQLGRGVTLNYGLFIQTVISFVIIAFAIFLVVRSINALKRKEAEAPSAPPAPSVQETLLTEIRDALRERVLQDRP